jgi:nitrite reductase/ring-hydroxylating ferredoxin subunit
MLKRVHKINRPLEPGEIVIAPVVGGQVVLWPPHRDIESGQPELHYHVDPRFRLTGGYTRPTGRAKWEPRMVVRPFIVDQEDGFDEYGPVQNVRGGTHIGVIYKCIKGRDITANGKCPHRGFNMAQAPTTGGIKVCPMHSMRFNAKTGKGIPYRKVKEPIEWDR